MSQSFSRVNRPFAPEPNSPFRLAFVFCVLALPATAVTTPVAPPAPEPAAPVTAREFFNAGTQKLREGKLREAEASLETALASQTEPLQPPALYNLGHVRFGQGAEELKKGPKAQPTLAQGRAATQSAADALRSADDALAGEDVEKMVASYVHGRGARKELKAAIKAVKRAMETHGAALGKWERSAGDFKSTLELSGADADAQANADTVEGCIAKLVDSLREMQQQAQAMAKMNGDLGEKLKKLKGRIPAEDAPPGGGGEDDEEDDGSRKPENLLGQEPGQKEGPAKDGNEMLLSPEQAGWLLDAFRLDSERRLPMGQTDTAEPKNRNRPTW